MNHGRFTSFLASYVMGLADGDGNMKHGDGYSTCFRNFVEGDKRETEAFHTVSDREIPPNVKKRLFDLAVHMHSIRLVRDREGKGNNFTIPAGYTYLGQLIAHDLAFHDQSRTRFANENRVFALPRTPKLDMDCVYGGGPVASPWLYERTASASESRWRLKLGRSRRGRHTDELTKSQDDVNRLRCPVLEQQNADGRRSARPQFEALVADPRNDENLLVSQLTVQFCKLHNIVAERIKSTLVQNGLLDARSLFDVARYIVVCLYRQIVSGDFLKRLVNDRTYERYMTYLDDGSLAEFKLVSLDQNKLQIEIPDEFWLAAFRTGHFMIQDIYNVSDTHSPTAPFGAAATITEILKQVGADSTRTPITEDWVVQWDRFFFHDSDIAEGRRLDNGREINHSHRLEPTAATNLGFRQRRFTAEDGHHSLLYLDLARALEHDLPSAQDILMGCKRRVDGQDRLTQPLERSECLPATNIRKWLQKDPDGGDGSELALSEEDADEIVNRTPLLFYLLCEADAPPQEGNCLGPLGSLIVAEVIVGALIASKETTLPETAKRVIGMSVNEMWSTLFDVPVPQNMVDLTAFIEREFTSHCTNPACSDASAPA